MPSYSKVEALRSFASKVGCLRRVFINILGILGLIPILPNQKPQKGAAF